MEYYKIIYNNAIVGASTSIQFARYSPVNKCLLYCSKEQGQYIIYNEGLYRDSWMKPLTTEIPCIEADVVIVEEDEYNIIIQALQTEDEIIINEPDEDIDDEPVIIPDSPTVEFIRTTKIKEMSYICRTTIENGFDLIIRGETRHFSLTMQDQLNLMTLKELAKTESLIPYHADGELSIFYTSEEINDIVSAANTFKIEQTTYYNALKNYINALDNIQDIAGITYGTPIPDEYKSDVLRVLE